MATNLGNITHNAYAQGTNIANRALASVENIPLLGWGVNGLRTSVQSSLLADGFGGGVFNPAHKGVESMPLGSTPFDWATNHAASVANVNYYKMKDLTARMESGEQLDPQTLALYTTYQHAYNQAFQLMSTSQQNKHETNKTQIQAMRV